MGKSTINTEVQEVSIKEAVKIISANKGMNMQEVATACGKGQSTLSVILNRGKLTLNSLHDILGGMDEDIVLLLSNGQKLKLKIKK